jgi:hypothetical protein
MTSSERRMQLRVPISGSDAGKQVGPVSGTRSRESPALRSLEMTSFQNLHAAKVHNGADEVPARS